MATKTRNERVLLELLKVPGNEVCADWLVRVHMCSDELSVLLLR